MKNWWGRLIKLGSHDSPHSRSGVDDGQLIEGEFTQEPTVGKRFNLYGHESKDCISTSRVESVLHFSQSSGRDKLVLPEDFPHASRVRFPETWQEGDYLFATLNSVYYLGGVEECVENKSQNPTLFKIPKSP